MGGISTQDRHELGLAIKDLEDSSGRLETIRNTLDSDMKGLKAKWHGDTANAFDKAIGTYIGRYNLTEQELRRIQSELRASLGDYTTTESETSADVNRVQGEINY